MRTTWIQWTLVLLTGFAMQAVGAQRDLDSLDAWVRGMSPAPFIRCGEQAWLDQLDDTREMWLEATPLERVSATNKLLQTLQDSHAAVSTMHWIWDVEKRRGTIPVRWAIEGQALWVMDSGVEGLPQEVRVLSLNGIPAEDCVKAACDLAPQEGESTVATARAAAHNITCWVLEATNTDSLTIDWVDPHAQVASTTKTFGVPLRKSFKAWAPISTRRPVVDWTFPDGTGLNGWDSWKKSREARRLSKEGHHIQTTWNGTATLKISSFSQGSWGRYHRRLFKGFYMMDQWNVPLVIDLRSNAGGQSPRMEALWRHIALQPATLPYALVAKQSPATWATNRKVYRRLRKRWIDKHRHDIEEAAYMYGMANLPIGEVDTLTFKKKPLASYRHEGAMALLIDGESASATVSFAGAFQAAERGPVIGEPCMGPAQGTMGNPYLMTLPESGIRVSLSTAVYMAQPTNDWAGSENIQPDFYVNTMWRRDSDLDQAIRLWQQTAGQSMRRR